MLEAGFFFPPEYLKGRIRERPVLSLILWFIRQPTVALAGPCLSQEPQAAFRSPTGAQECHGLPSKVHVSRKLIRNWTQDLMDQIF